MQQPTIPDYIRRALKELRLEVRRDSWNLTRDDHDAIDIRIDQLEQFILQRYGSHSSGFNCN